MLCIHNNSLMLNHIFAFTLPEIQDVSKKGTFPDFDVPFPVTGTGMTNSNPIFGNGNGNENSIPIFGNGNESEKFHSRLSGRELEDGIPGNSREILGIPGIGNSRDIAIAKSTAGPKIGGEVKTQEVVQDGGDNCCNFVSHLLCLSCDHPRQGEPRFYLDPFVCHRNELLKALSVLVKRSAGLGHVRDEGLVESSIQISVHI